MIARFNDDDHRLMMDSVKRALAAGQDGETLAWKNDKTGASGEVTPLNRLRWNQLDCRRVQIANTYKSQSSRGVYRFCEQPKGQWKLAGVDGGKP